MEDLIRGIVGTDVVIRMKSNLQETIMSKQPHHQQGSPSGSGGNSGRQTGAEPRLQNGAGMSKKERNVGPKKSATKPQKKTA